MIRLRIGFIREPLWRRHWTFGFHQPCDQFVILLYLGIISKKIDHFHFIYTFFYFVHARVSYWYHPSSGIQLTIVLMFGWHSTSRPLFVACYDDWWMWILLFTLAKSVDWKLNYCAKLFVGLVTSVFKLVSLVTFTVEYMLWKYDTICGLYKCFYVS